MQQGSVTSLLIRFAHLWKARPATSSDGIESPITQRPVFIRALTIQVSAVLDVLSLQLTV